MINQNLLPVLFTAMDKSRDGITISDATKPDMPLIYVNEGFLKMTGYNKNEVLGKNCRFLQGHQRNQAGIETLRKAIRNGEPALVELLNYRKTGEPFWNKLSMTPVFDDGGKLVYFIGVQDDITLEKEKILLEQKIERQKLIGKITLEAQEKERQLIGAELHDNINQMLATAKLYLNLAKDKEEMRLDMVNASSEVISSSINEIRKLSHKLVGQKEPELVLRESLHLLLQDMKVGSKINVALHWNVEDEQWVAEEVKLALYRIAQEQLNNSIKYARANTITIAVNEVDDELQMAVADDGVGFDPETVTKGIGLRNIEARLEMLEGRMDLQTSPGSGCQLTVTIPK